MPEPSGPPDETSRRTLWRSEVRARLLSLRLSPTRETEIVDELSQHLDDHYRELIAGGVSPEEAARRHWPTSGARRRWRGIWHRFNRRR